MHNCISESDMDVKLELKSVMDKIRTFSLGKNKEIVVSSPYLREVTTCRAVEYGIVALKNPLKDPCCCFRTSDV